LTKIVRADPASEQARAMARALWDEIQRRYGFTADDPYDPTAYTGRGGAFWLAMDDDRAVGSVALSPIDQNDAELDVMYVASDYRRRGVARALLAALEEHARAAGISRVLLRSGEPQPEAMRFYADEGFTPIPPFGKWVGDDTARCLAKPLS
jgi:GNAT superfamily N-acetyltransferase